MTTTLVAAAAARRASSSASHVALRRRTLISTAAIVVPFEASDRLRRVAVPPPRFSSLAAVLPSDYDASRDDRGRRRPFASPRRRGFVVLEDGDEDGGVGDGPSSSSSSRRRNGAGGRIDDGPAAFRSSSLSSLDGSFSVRSGTDGGRRRRRRSVGVDRGPPRAALSLVPSRRPRPTTMPTTESPRHMSSVADLFPSLPDFAQNWTIWGGSGHILRTIHWNGTVPYWACVSITNVMVRTSLLPLVVSSARTSERFAKVAPEVQFLVTLYQKDLKGLRERNATPVEVFSLSKYTLRTLRGLYKLHDVHPFAVFKAPLLQIPVFWYFAVDIRKIINGADPALAQELTESGFLWVTDLTEPDPWHGLPIITGMLMYLSIELAIGKKSLSGEAASRSNVARALKDFFQSLAVFMPCFMSQSPAGVQIYLATSFLFTMVQGAALRNDSVRSSIGLKPLGSPTPEPVHAKEFLELKKKEKEAKEARGDDGEVLGKGVLSPGFEGSFAGTSRMTDIGGAKAAGATDEGDVATTTAAAPPFPAQEPVAAAIEQTKKGNELEEVPASPEALMDAANEGRAAPRPIQIVKSAARGGEDGAKTKPSLNVNRFLKKRGRGKKKSTGKKNK